MAPLFAFLRRLVPQLIALLLLSAPALLPALGLIKD